MKYRKVIVILLVIGITLLVVYFGGSMLMGLMQGGHVPPIQH